MGGPAVAFVVFLCVAGIDFIKSGRKVFFFPWRRNSVSAEAPSIRRNRDGRGNVNHFERADGFKKADPDNRSSGKTTQSK